MWIFSRTGFRALAALAALAFFWSCATVEREAPSPEQELPAIVEMPTPEDLERKPAIATLSEAEPDAARRSALANAGRALAAQAERHGLEALRGDVAKYWGVAGPQGTLALVEGKRRAELDNIVVYLDQPFAKRKGGLALSESDADLLLPALAKPPDRLPRRARLIAIDPGHGGSEEGAKNASLSLIEKELNLDVSVRLEEHLRALGFRTVMTRYDDRLVSLRDRPDIANRAKADLFVSIHFNASTKPDAIGLETYMLTPEGEASTADEEAGLDSEAWPANGLDSANFAFAYRIQKALVGKLQRHDRGVRKARFGVLKTLQCPGALVECGFLSNQEEALLVRTPVYREKLAAALAAAIAAFAEELAPEA